jgi:hypothetical protein
VGLIDGEDAKSIVLTSPSKTKDTVDLTLLSTPDSKCPKYGAHELSRSSSNRGFADVLSVQCNQRGNKRQMELINRRMTFHCIAGAGCAVPTRRGRNIGHLVVGQFCSFGGRRRSCLWLDGAPRHLMPAGSVRTHKGCGYQVLEKLKLTHYRTFDY